MHIAPDLPQQVLTTHDFADAIDQHAKDLRFVARQLDLLVVARHREALEVHSEAREPQHGSAFARWRLRPTHLRAA